MANRARAVVLTAAVVFLNACGAEREPLQPIHADGLEEGELAQRALVLESLTWRVEHRGRMTLPEPAYRALYRASVDDAWAGAALGKGLRPAYEVSLALPERADFRTASLISDSISRAEVRIHRPDGTLAAHFELAVVSAKALVEDPVCRALGHRYTVPALAAKLAWALDRLREGDVTVARLLGDGRLPNMAYEVLRLNPYKIHAMTAEETESITGLQLSRFGCPPARWTNHGPMPVTRLSTRALGRRAE